MVKYNIRYQMIRCSFLTIKVYKNFLVGVLKRVIIWLDTEHKENQGKLSLRPKHNKVTTLPTDKSTTEKNKSFSWDAQLMKKGTLLWR